MTKTELYYKFLKRFDTNEPFTKREALLWYGAITEGTDEYPFNGYDISSIQDAWRLNSHGRIAKPKGELKVYSEVSFNSVFNSIRSIACSAPSEGHTEEPTGIFVTAPDDTSVELLETYWAIQETREVIPAEWRRDIRHLTGKGNKGKWMVGSIQRVVTRKTVGARTAMEEIEKSVEGKVTKNLKIIRQQTAALESGNLGDFHPSLIKLLSNAQKSEAGNLTVVQTVIKGLRNSEKEINNEENKKEILNLNDKMKAQDAHIKRLEDQLALK